LQCKKTITALPNFGVFAICSFFILSGVQNLLGEHHPVQPVLVYKLVTRFTSSENKKIREKKGFFIVYISISVGLQDFHMVCLVEAV
jgi:hypothetical protein